MNKIFSPIGRWSFLVSFFFAGIFYNLFLHFGFFFFPDGMIAAYFIFYIALFFIFSKRIYDITDKLKLSILLTVVILGLGVLLNAIMYNQFKKYAFIIIALVGLIGLIYTSSVVLFLIFKKGHLYDDKIKFNIKTTIIRTLIVIITFSLFKALTSSFIFTTLPLIDRRMYPSLHFIDNILVKKISKSADIKRGDIVCIGENVPVPFRVLGLPNETIEFKGKELYINGNLTDDDFAFYKSNLKPINLSGKITLDDSSYYLIGDNRYYDSTGEELVFNKKKKGTEWRKIDILSFGNIDTGRIFNVVKKENIKGKVVGVRYVKSKKIKFLQKDKPFGFQEIE